MIERSTGILSDEDIRLLQGLKKKDHIVCYIIAALFAVLVLFRLYQWGIAGNERFGVMGIIFSGVALSLAGIGWYMQQQYRMIQACIDKGEKNTISGILRDLVLAGRNQVRYCFDNNTTVDVYLPLDQLHKRPLQSVAAIKDTPLTLHITSGDKPILLQADYAGNPVETDRQPVTDQDRKPILKGLMAVVWVMAGCLVVVLLIVGISSKWSTEALVLAFSLPALITMLIAYLLYLYEKRLTVKMDERLTVSGKITEIIVARVGAGKHSAWHYFYRIGPYTFDMGRVSKQIPGNDVQIGLLRMKNGKAYHIISVRLNNSNTV